MHIPGPREQLAGCMWLARIIAKARLHLAGELAAEYDSRLGSPTGVDGQFLDFFGLRIEAVLGVAAGDDASVEQWFLNIPGNSRARIGEWNKIAVSLGRAGYPMADRLPAALARGYPNVDPEAVETVFDILEADEGIDPASL